MDISQVNEDFTPATERNSEWWLWRAGAGGAEKQDVEWVDSWRLENDELGGLAESFAKCFASNKV